MSCGAQQTASISSDTPKISAVQSVVQVSAQSIIAQMDKGKYKEGELLVKFKSGVVTTSSLKIHQGVGASVTKKFTVVPNLELVKLPQGLSIKDAILQYMADPNVEYAEPNYIKRASAARIPTDQYFGQQWALHNIGQFAGGTEDADIDAPEAWDISQGSSSIIVAVLDTGIDYNHPDLVNNIWINNLDPIQDPLIPVDDDGNGVADDYRGWDFTTCAQFNQLPPYNCITPKLPDNDPMDDNGHGTHVAGIIGAVGNNGVGVSGVMWNVKLMALKFLNADGEGTTADEIAGIQYAIAKGAKIINASFGSEEYSSSEYNAINAANAAGILFVAAAGNGGKDGIGDNNDLTPFYPASYNLSNIISVAATDQNDVRASFSNFGNSVHVAAPGVYILSTVPTHIYPTGYINFNMGTSMSTAHVSGLAGLLYSYYDGIYNTLFTYSQVRSTILRYGDPKPSLVDIQTGKRINAYWAVSSLRIPTNLTATAASPTQISITWSDNATGEDGYKIERKIGGDSYTEIAIAPANVSSFTDSSLTPQTTYMYRVKVFNTISESFYSNEASATTQAEPVVQPGGGGGGCSIGARQNTPTAVADFAVMLVPLLFVVVAKFRRKI